MGFKWVQPVVVELKHVENLSDRQREILRLIAKNLQIKEVAHILNISPNTVKTHTEVARRRLGAQSTREAARAVIDFDNREGITHLGGDSKRGIADKPTHRSSMDYEQAIHTTTDSLPDNSLERFGDITTSSSDTGEGTHGRGSLSGIKREEFKSVTDPNNLLPHSRNRMVDWGLDSFIHRLKSLNSLQWSGLVVIVFALSALLFIGLLSIGLNLVEAIKLLHHQVGT